LAERLKGPLAVGLCLIVIAVAAAPLSAQVTAEQIDKAVERGVESLWALQKADGSWGNVGAPGDYHYYISGQDVCALMGLAYGGASANDERLQKALKVVLAAKLNKNYARAVRMIALAKLYPRLRREKQELVKKCLKADLEWTYKAQDPEGDFNYTGTGKGELSNTQLALLGVYEASLIFKELPNTLWKKAMSRYLVTQKPDGGWNYGHRSDIHVKPASYGSMTAAAVASLMIARDKLYGASGCPCKNGKSQRRGNPQLDKAINDGIAWCAKNFVVDKNPGRGGSHWMYWAFGCERIGLASGIKYFGTHDWYKELTAEVLARQGTDGGWGHTSNTALAIAFLVKGRAPILFNKVRFDGQWNNHARDIANLATYVGKQKEQAIQWQVINLSVPVAEWHDAPILYISAETPLEASDEEKKKLREFTDTGGTILFEASCGNRQVIQAWELVCKEVWPEWEFKLVDRKHDLWTADQVIRGRLPKLLGLSDGTRTFLFFSKADISCAWNTMAMARNRLLFDLGGNLYMYSTDKGKLRARLADRGAGTGSKYGEPTLTAGDRKSLKVARVKHGGQWYLAKNYHGWQHLGADLQSRVGVTVTSADPIVPGGDVPGDIALLHYSGGKGSGLDASGAAWLKTTADAGTFLLAEATLGNREFDAELRATLEQAGLALRTLPKDHAIVTGQMGGATGYAIESVGYSFHLRADRVGQVQPLLHGIYSGTRLVGLYSPFDLMFSQTGSKAFGNRGYAGPDARALASNIVLYLTTDVK
jgi:Domain of unknown function (DUF4159)